MWIFNDEYQNSYPVAFIDSLAALMDNGRETSPRGMKTKELDHVSFKIDPKKCLYTSPIRDLNFFFLIAENLWYWSGRNSTELPSYYVKNYRSFSDEGIHQGSYSPMILEQIRYVVNQLKADPDTRQAVMTLWRPNPQDSKDKPCTLLFDFKIRDGKLNMHATMRSNDAIWGNNYDIPSFSMLLIAISGIIGIEPGFLYLTAHSYHIYERHFKLAEQLITESWHCDEYPEKLKFQNCTVTDLSSHIASIERLLASHYLIQSGNFQGSGGLSDFYAQFVQMMNLHKAISYFDDNVRDNSIKNLKVVNSPFGTIYHERYNIKK